MRADKKQAKDAGIPSYLRQYAKRYGVDVDDIIRRDKQMTRPRKNEN